MPERKRQGEFRVGIIICAAKGPLHMVHRVSTRKIVNREHPG